MDERAVWTTSYLLAGNGEPPVGRFASKLPKPDSDFVRACLSAHVLADIIATQGLGGANDDCLVGETWVRGKTKLKRRAAGSVCGRPQSSAMRFNDRTADRQPHPQTAGLRCVEGLEKPIDSRKLQSWSRISH